MGWEVVIVCVRWLWSDMTSRHVSMQLETGNESNGPGTIQEEAPSHGALPKIRGGIFTAKRATLRQNTRHCSLEIQPPSWTNKLIQDRPTKHENKMLAMSSVYSLSFQDTSLQFRHGYTVRNR